MTVRPFFHQSAISAFVVIVSLSISLASDARAQVSAFMQGVAETAASDREIAEFYRDTGFEPIWTGNDRTSKRRREALLRAVAEADAHGLPPARYDPATLSLDLRSVRSERDLGRLEVEMSRLFLRYARDVQTGILNPQEVVSDIKREVPYRGRTALLTAFSRSSPAAFLKSLPPKDPEYARLMKEKLRFEKIIGAGGWGPEVRARKLEPGQTGDAVIQLRNRLIAMRYLRRTASASYDQKMVQAVAAFQRDHGLVSDGVAGGGTLSAINVSPEARLGQIMVAMERERWMNAPRGARHIWVNITDYHARIVDNGKVTFQTRSVVGHTDSDRQTPEFSDIMEHMVINPTWNVPRSIATKEYLPLLQRNPFAVGHLNLIDTRGRIVPRGAVDFTQFNERNFPFDMREPPNRSNALGLVKFMFPNRYNIYLHDTPAKNLFGREARAFSHGCIRLNDPFDFAYELLSRQTSDPEGFFKARLATGRETVVELEKHVPVHLVYRSAFTQAKGRIQFRNDVYGRDARIWKALERAGVSLRPVQG